MHPTTLRLTPVTPSPAMANQLYPVYASNLDFLRLTDDVADPLPRDYVERSLEAEFAVPGQRFLLVHDSDELVGLATYLAPHPNEPYPWIGLLMIDGTRRRTGLGRATATLVEQHLAVEGWTQVRLGVLTNNIPALRFWLDHGYTVYDEQDNTGGHSCLLLKKPLD